MDQPTTLAARNSASVFKRLHGLSIGARLALGFGLIAALFMAANYFTQENAAKVTAQIEASNRASRNLDEAARALNESLEQLRRAVRELIDVNHGATAQKSYLLANASLVESTTLYAQSDTAIAGTLDADGLTQQVEALQIRSAGLLAKAKRRDELLNRYWTDLDRLESKLAETQQELLRFGDHSFTRTSAVEMSRALLAVRSAVDAYLAYPNAQRATTIDLQEENFLVALAKNSRALAAAKSDAWLESVRKDFSDVQRLQRRTRLARDTTQSEFSALSTDIDTLLESIRRGISGPAAGALLRSAQMAGDIARRADRNVALLSVGTLGLILIISLLTARSVTLPVGRLIQATRRLGSGDDVAHVTRGGVRELDELARAFNEMAGQLAEAKRGVQEEQTKLEERVAERTQQLQHLAYHDALTQLPNRRHLFKHLNAVVDRPKHERQAAVLLLLDLDNFKTLNDSLGHLFGDRVLKAVSERLLEQVEHDGFAARLGGDEFTIVRELRSTSEDIAAQAAKLLASFQRPLKVDDREVIVGLSIGAAVYPDHAQDAESLLRAADSALFKAKALGRNQTCVSSAELVDEISAQFRTEQALRRAIQCDELELVFQPQVCLNLREVTAVEALLRWKRDGDYILPLDFLPLAEQSGLITEITDWALKRAIQALASWRQTSWPQARVAVNISAQQFLDRRFVARLDKLLTLYDVLPGNLELELTETVLQSGATTIRTLQELRELGVGIALDDFGAGYSSLASLEQLQLSRVKIDRSLIANVDRNARAASIARAMISLCRSLNLRVTAEGVERPDQLRFLMQCEPVDAQGFLLSHPRSAEHVVGVCKQLPTLLNEMTDRIRPRTSNSVAYLPLRGIPQ